MKYTYKVRVDIKHDEDGRVHTVYGIDLLCNDDIVKSLPDIFFDRSRAEQLAELCNSLDLSPLHLEDVAEDALAGIL